jgi:hypothetical protein
MARNCNANVYSGSFGLLTTDDGKRGAAVWRGRRVGKDPIGPVAAECYLATMGLILLILILLILFGGGGFYFGGPIFGGGGIGLILLICLIVYLMGGFRSKS